MGTVFTITVLGADAHVAEVDRAFEWLRWVEQTFFVFDPDSEITRMSDGRLQIEDASKAVRDVLADCDALSEATGKTFSIRPQQESRPRLDPSGYVKGWSVDRAASALSAAGVMRFTIDAGGDILCVGTAPSGTRWRVGIRLPSTPDAMGAVLTIAEGAVATSGTYFRGDHIWRDGTCDDETVSATVVGPSLGIADSLAKAIFADQAESLAWMSAFPDYGVALMNDDGRLRWTEQLDGSIELHTER
jgi:thiamine biosynthesis lipoprotein